MYTRQLQRTKPVMKGEDIIDIQQILKNLGFYKGEVDGNYGPLTEKAVKAYQRSKKLKVDGIVGRITWGSLHPTTEEGGLVSYAAAQVGCLYVSGGEGEEETEARIKQLEKDPDDERRALAHFFDHVKKLLSRIGFDCSGLIIHYLKDIVKLISRDYNANGIFYELCDEIDRTELQAEDLVFKKYPANSRMYHVGTYMGDGTVVHAKGRDYGVVRESINATKWNRYGRLKCLRG